MKKTVVGLLSQKNKIKIVVPLVDVVAHLAFYVTKLPY
jgi:hypothetical protein